MFYNFLCLSGCVVTVFLADEQHLCLHYFVSMCLDLMSMGHALVTLEGVKRLLYLENDTSQELLLMLSSSARPKDMCVGSSLFESGESRFTCGRGHATSVTSILRAVF